MSEKNLDTYIPYLIDRYVPVTIFLTRDLDILYVHGNIEHYLSFPQALVQFNIARMVDEEVLNIFKDAVTQCLEEGGPVVYRQVRFPRKKAEMTADLRFQRTIVSGKEGPVILVEFLPLAANSGQFPDPKSTEGREAWEEHIKNLEYQLRGIRQEKQNLVDEQEAVNEELQTSNRELMASNEELQSTNEELQSVNEELYAVNSELQLKNEALTTANNDILNLLKSTEIGTIFLDKDLKVRRFTPAVRKHFNLLDTDIGRPISDFSNNLIDIDISKISRKVFQELDKFEQEVEDLQGNRYLLRVLPYRTQDNVILGLVITFVDVNELIGMRERLMVVAEKFEALFQNAEEVILELSDSGEIRSASKGLGIHPPKAIIGKQIYDLLAESVAEKLRVAIEEMLLLNHPMSHHIEISGGNDDRFYYQARLIPLKKRQSVAADPVKISIILVLRDVTESTRKRNELEEHLKEYEAFMDNARHQIALIDRQGKIKYLNYAQHTGVAKDQVIGTRIYDYLAAGDREKVKQSIAQIFAGEPFENIRFTFENAETKPMDVELVATPVIIGQQIRYIALIGYELKSP